MENKNKFAAIAFSPGVRAAQEHYGTRVQNERLEAFDRFPDGLTEMEADFIAERDGFYMATVIENGYPYVQFRGGPAGFLKLLDAHTLGYADFRGNQQYISVGNLSRNDHVALILMDYRNRRRLKIFAHAEVRDAQDDPGLVEKLEVPSYRARVERAMILHVEAFDWNCPQHITPKFTADEIEIVNQPIYEHVERLEQEIAELKTRLQARDA